jgi:hypothetical protein
MYIDFMWRNNPKSIVASIKQTLVNLFMSDATRPADHSKLITVEMNNNGALAFAVGRTDETSISKFSYHSYHVYR